MQVGGITEIIMHFVGLLHIDLDPERVWERVEGSAKIAIAPFDAVDGRSPSPPPADIALDPAGATTLPHAQTDADSPLRFDHLKYHPLAGHPFHAQPPSPPIHLVPPDLPAGGGGGGDGADSGLQASYPVPDEIVADVHQANMLIADNVMVDRTGAWAEASSATGLHLQHMIDISEAAGAQVGVPFGSSASTLVAGVDAHADQIFGSHPDMSVMTPGTTVDGISTSSDGSPGAVAFPDAVLNALTQASALIAAGNTATAVPFGISVETGGNTVANAAVIVDTSAAHLDQIVMGNAYHADIIVQDNVVSTIDNLALVQSEASSAGALTAVLSNALDTIHNTAHFEAGPLDVSGVVTASLGAGWSVNIAQGDFYDIQTITQQNVLINDNVYVGTPQTDHYQAVLGGNIQGNGYELIHDGPSYDLLIVMGNSYTGTFISQTNVLLAHNATGVTLPSDPSDTTIAAGGNVVTNEASIYDASNSATQPLSADVSALAQELLASNGTQIPAGTNLAFPGLGGPLDILLVTGNYYSLNVISQTNVVANSGVVDADLSKVLAGTPTTVVTGANTLQNSAAVVTVAGQSTANYVGGQAYDSAFLVQANVVSTQAQTQFVQPSALVPELAAFLSSEATTGHETTSPPTVTAALLNAAHQDVLAGTLH